MLFGMCAVTVLTVFNQVTLERSLLSIQEQQVKGSFDLGTLNLNNLISNMETSALAIAHFSSEIYQIKKHQPTVDNDRIFKSYLFDTFALLEKSIGGGVWFEPFKLEPTEKRYGPYVYRENNELLFTWELNSPEYNYHDRAWYKDTFNAKNLNDNGVFWSQPYYDDAGTNELMVTISAPIKDQQSNLIGVSTVDWAIKHLSNEVANIEFTENSSAFLIDKSERIFLAFPDNKESFFKPVTTFSWGADITDKASTEIGYINDITFNSQEGVIYFIAARENLILGIFLPNADYLQYIDEVTNRNLALSIAVSIIFLLLLVFLLNRLFSPFDQILASIRQSISQDKENNSITVAPIKEYGEKEFSSIIKALNQVYNTINQHASELNATNIELKNKQVEVNDLNLHLEEKVAERTIELETKNTEVLRVLTELQQAQKQMVQMEKNAALGKLVSGVAHEVNTPIGVCVTATSVLQENYISISESLTENRLTKLQLENFINAVNETLNLLTFNLERINQLIDSFKQVSTDQLNEQPREFVLNEYLALIVSSMKPLLDKAKVNVHLPKQNAITLTSFPGVFSQIMNNLIMNSILHAFDDIEQKEITIDVQPNDDQITITYQDNGNGMSEDIQAKIFEPFFTTKRGHGGTGLGMHITFNLVTQKLNGQIQVESTEGKGTTVSMIIPTEIAVPTPLFDV